MSETTGHADRPRSAREELLGAVALFIALLPWWVVIACVALPHRPKAAAPAPPSSGPLDYSNYDFKMYVVRAGDDPERIAAQFDTTADLVVRYNKLPAGVALRRGEKILIPIRRQPEAEQHERAKGGIF